MDTDEDVEGLILCGGYGSRMGGEEKGLREFRGRPAVTIAAAILAPLCRVVHISANRDLEAYRALDLGPVRRDLRDGFQGPLAGLEQLVPHVKSDALLLLPCDMPLLSGEVPTKLLSVLHSEAELQLTYARGNGRDHFLCAALRRSALQELSAFLDEGHRAVRAWYATLAHRAVDFSPPASLGLRNFNHPQDWIS